jgi:hypothetical protein
MAGVRVSLIQGVSHMGNIKKNLDLIFIALLLLSLVFYDQTMEILTEIAHVVFELSFELFEWIELGIEEIIEHLFHTEHHASQIVTFYILLLIGGFVVYGLWQILPGLYHRLMVVVKREALKIWVRRKTEWELYWFTLDLPYKIFMGVIAVGVVYIALFL